MCEVHVPFLQLAMPLTNAHLVLTNFQSTAACLWPRAINVWCSDTAETQVKGEL